MAGYGYKELNTFYLDNEFPSGVNMEMDEVIKVTLYCNFHFQSFPFDDQKCDLSLYDAIYTKETTVLNATTNGGDSDLCYKEKQCKWFHENEWIFLPEQYGIPYIIKMKYKGTNNFDVDLDHHDQKSVFTIKFAMKRNSLGHLVGSFYLPTGLFAFLSIGSYIINPDIVSIMKHFLSYFSKIYMQSL